MKKQIKKIADRKSISRNELLAIINKLELEMNVEGFSTLLNWKESLGFGRYEDAQK